MFILTCPSCSHTVQVKFARMGASATCPSCKARFAVSTDTVTTESGGEVMEVEGDRLAPKSLTRAWNPFRPADEPAEEERGEKHRPHGIGASDPHQLSGADRLRRIRQRRLPRFGSKSIAIAGLLLMTAGVGLLATMLFWEGDNGSSSSPPAQPVAQTSPPQVTPAAEPGQQDVTEPPYDPDPGAAPPDPSAGAALPTLDLASSQVRNSYWTRFAQPVEPIRPYQGPGVRLWAPRLQRHPTDDRAMFTALFVGEPGAVYESAFLHVQLLNDAGLAYAELKQVVPILPAGLGLQVRLPVPAEYLDAYQGLVAELAPLNLIGDAVPLEMVQAQHELIGRNQGARILQLAVLNPYDYPVSAVELVIEVLTPEGWPIAQWRGSIDARIGPHETLTFQAAPPLPSDATPGRVIIRGYAHKTG